MSSAGHLSLATGDHWICMRTLLMSHLFFSAMFIFLIRCFAFFGKLYRDELVFVLNQVRAQTWKNSGHFWALGLWLKDSPTHS